MQVSIEHLFCEDGIDCEILLSASLSKGFKQNHVVVRVVFQVFNISKALVNEARIDPNNDQLNKCRGQEKRQSSPLISVLNYFDYEQEYWQV